MEDEGHRRYGFEMMDATARALPRVERPLAPLQEFGSTALPPGKYAAFNAARGAAAPVASALAIGVTVLARDLLKRLLSGESSPVPELVVAETDGILTQLTAFISDNPWICAVVGTLLISVIHNRFENTARFIRLIEFIDAEARSVAIRLLGFAGYYAPQLTVFGLGMYVITVLYTCCAAAVGWAQEGGVALEMDPDSTRALFGGDPRALAGNLTLAGNSTQFDGLSKGIQEAIAAMIALGATVGFADVGASGLRPGDLFALRSGAAFASDPFVRLGLPASAPPEDQPRLARRLSRTQNATATQLWKTVEMLGPDATRIFHGMAGNISLDRSKWTQGDADTVKLRLVDRSRSNFELGPVSGTNAAFGSIFYLKEAPDARFVPIGLLNTLTGANWTLPRYGDYQQGVFVFPGELERLLRLGSNRRLSHPEVMFTHAGSGATNKPPDSKPGESGDKPPDKSSTSEPVSSQVLAVLERTVSKVVSGEAGKRVVDGAFSLGRTFMGFERFNPETVPELEREHHWMLERVPIQSSDVPPSVKAKLINGEWGPNYTPTETELRRALAQVNQFNIQERNKKLSEWRNAAARLAELAHDLDRARIIALEAVRDKAVKQRDARAEAERAKRAQEAQSRETELQMQRDTAQREYDEAWSRAQGPMAYASLSIALSAAIQVGLHSYNNSALLTSGRSAALHPSGQYMKFSLWGIYVLVRTWNELVAEVGADERNLTIGDSVAEAPLAGTSGTSEYRKKVRRNLRQGKIRLAYGLIRDVGSEMVNSTLQDAVGDKELDLDSNAYWLRMHLWMRVATDPRARYDQGVVDTLFEKVKWGKAPAYEEGETPCQNDVCEMAEKDGRRPPSVLMATRGLTKTTPWVAVDLKSRGKRRRADEFVDELFDHGAIISLCAVCAAGQNDGPKDWNLLNARTAGRALERDLAVRTVAEIAAAKVEGEEGEDY
jgi:hypothetical protein